MTASQDFQNWLDDYVTGRVRVAVSPLEDLLADSAETVSAQALVIADRDRQVVEQAAVIAARDATIVDLRAQLAAKPDPVPAGPVKRTAENTAVIDRATLRVHEGDLIISGGAVHEGLLVKGKVNFAGAGTLRRSVVLGPQSPPTSSIGCINATSATTERAILETVFVDPSHPSSNLDGIRGHDMTMRDVRIRNVVDGLGLYNSHRKGTPLNVDIDGLLIDELAWFPSTSHADRQSHNDCIQIHGGTGLKMRNFTLSGRYGTAGAAQPAVTGPTPVAANPSLALIMFNVGQGTTGFHDITDGWCDFGHLPINCGGAPGVDLGKMHRVVFDGKAGLVRTPPVTIWRRADQKLDVQDCTFPDGTPIFVRTNG